MDDDPMCDVQPTAGPSSTPEVASPPARAPPPSLQRSTTGDEVLAVPSLPSGDDGDGEPPVEGFEDQVDEHGNRVSMYVRSFEEMLDTVLEHESYLFSSLELATFARYRALSYNARYLLTRLMLRKPRVHRLIHLERSYASELGRHVGDAMDELSAGTREGRRRAAARTTVVKQADKVQAAPVAAAPTKLDKCAATSGKGKDMGRAVPVVKSKVKGKAKADSAVIDLVSSDSDIEIVESSTSTSTPSTRHTSPSKLISRESMLPPSTTTSAAAAAAKGKGKAASALSLSEDVTSALSLEDEALDLAWFCAGPGEEDEERLLRSLQMEEVRDVARGMKCWKAGLNYNELVDVVLKSARSQSTLSFPVLAPSRSTTDISSPKQGTLPFGGSAPVNKADTGAHRLRKVVLDVMGKAIVVNPDVRKLWGRLNLIFYRSTMTPPSLLLPQILTKAQKRHYPSYNYSRTLSLFPTRAALVAYEKALLLETEVDDALGEQETLNGRRPFSKHFEGKVGFGNGLGRREGAEVVRAIWGLVWERWKAEVERAKAEGREGEGARTVSDRFQPGHVLTRIVYKGAYALGVLHEYENECAVLRALLAQKVWRRGRRGAWYERLALILMTHFKGPQQEEKRREAMETCLDGLEDDDTHLIYRPSLVRRLTRLESQLSIPYKQRHLCDGSLAEPTTTVLPAPRIRPAAVQPGDSDSEDDARSVASVGGRARRVAGEGGTTWGTKSAWVGREGGEVGVEQWVLEQWEDKGWKGFHAEGSIVTTLFGLLFWDVFFADVEGVFETPFQSAPLDLGEDTFALARADLVARRLQEIADGKAPTILAEVDAREREHGTLCVGVRWEFSREDLGEIVECLGGKSLEVICRMLSEEYGHRSSGVPDLLVWKHDERRARFVEVKGPGDRLSSTQQVWLDVLIGAGVEVEVCKVVEADADQLRSMSRSVSPVKRALSPEWEDELGEEEEASDRPVNYKKRRNVCV